MEFDRVRAQKIKLFAELDTARPAALQRITSSHRVHLVTKQDTILSVPLYSRSFNSKIANALYGVLHSVVPFVVIHWNLRAVLSRLPACIFLFFCIVLFPVFSDFFTQLIVSQEVALFSQRLPQLHVYTGGNFTLTYFRHL